MDDPDDPYSPDNLSWNWRFGGPKWRPFTRLSGRGPRVPPPPCAGARAERLHLVGLTNAAVIIMGVVLGAVVVMLVLVVVSHH